MRVWNRNRTICCEIYLCKSNMIRCGSQICTHRAVKPCEHIRFSTFKVLILYFVSGYKLSSNCEWIFIVQPISNNISTPRIILVIDGYAWRQASVIRDFAIAVFNFTIVNTCEYDQIEGTSYNLSERDRKVLTRSQVTQCELYHITLFIIVDVIGWPIFNCWQSSDSFDDQYQNKVKYFHFYF